MAFATQRGSVTGGNSGGNVSTQVITFPAGVTTGDLVIVIASKDGAANFGAISSGSNWTTVVNTNAQSAGFAIYRKILDGSGDNLTLAVSTEGVAWTSIAFVGGTFNRTTPIAVGTTANGASVSPAPPANTPSWGALDTTWIACGGNDGNVAISAYPTNYGSDNRNDRWANTGGSGTYIATRQLNTTTQTPGVFTMGSDGWLTQTIAVNPNVGQTATPTTPALTLATFAPTVTATLNVRVTPTTTAQTLTAFAPTVSAPRLVTPSVTALTTGTFAPTVSTPRLATPATAGLTSTAFAPTIVTPQTITPSVLALSLATFEPTAATPILATPGIVAAVLTTFAPDVTVEAGGVTVTPATVELATEVFAPSVSAGQRVTPTAATLTLASFAASIGTPVVVTPPTRLSVLSNQTPNLGEEIPPVVPMLGGWPMDERLPYPRRFVVRPGRIVLNTLAPDVRIIDDGDVFAMLALL